MLQEHKVQRRKALPDYLTHPDAACLYHESAMITFVSNPAPGLPSCRFAPPAKNGTSPKGAIYLESNFS